MAAAARIYAGARSPESLDVTMVTPTGQDFDVNAVVGVNFVVSRRPAASSGSASCCDEPQQSLSECSQPQVWSAAVLQRCVLTRSVRAAHAFVDGDDVDVPGLLTVYPQLVLADGTRRCQPFDLLVLPYGAPTT